MVKGRRPNDGLRSKLCQRVRALLVRRPVGSRLPGERALAQEMGTSEVTMRVVLQQLLAEGLVERRPQSGTYVAPRSHRTAAQLPIALVSVHDLFDPHCSRFHLFLMGDLRRRLAERGRSSRVYIGNVRTWDAPDESESPTSIVPADFVADAESGRLGGAVLLSNLGAEGEGALSALRAANRPIVASADRQVVGMDEAWRGALRRAVHSLAASGRRRLALMAWAESPNPSGQSKRAYTSHREVFLAELRLLGLEADPQLVRDEFHPTRRFAGADALRELWVARRDRFDGLIIADDVLGRTALPALAAMGPALSHRVSVVCHANEGDPLIAPFPIAWMRVEREPIVNALLNRLVEPPAKRSDSVVGSIAWVESAIRSDAAARVRITPHADQASHKLVAVHG